MSDIPGRTLMRLVNNRVNKCFFTFFAEMSSDAAPITDFELIFLQPYFIYQCNLFSAYEFYFPEYGVLHSMHCRKFKLDKNNPNERYGLQIDGNLHINNYMYSVDDYCVEFTKMETIEVFSIFAIRFSRHFLDFQFILINIYLLFFCLVFVSMILWSS